MRGQQVSIPIRGINNQLLDDQSIDGLCDSIINLKPNGVTDDPHWVPFEKINSLRSDAGLAFSYEFGMASITDAFWQVRNFIGEFADDTEGSLKRLLILCQNESRKCIDILDPDTWAVVKTQALPSDGNYAWSCTRVDEITVINITKDKKPYLLYYLQDDSFIPQGWPEMPSISFSTTTATFTEPEVLAGTTEGVMRKNVDQYFLVTMAFRLFDNTYVKHQRFELVKVDLAAGDPVLDALIPVFTLDGYTEIENILINQPFWSALIAGISVFATLPADDEKKALDDGNFYEVGFWPFIDKLPEEQWPTAEDPNILTIRSKSDNWPTLLPLNIDSFTHHKFAANVVDTYNKRLLLGGSTVDFAMPKIKTNATKNTVPGGVYSDYLTYDSGSGGDVYSYYDDLGNEVSQMDDWFYDKLHSTHVSILNPKAGREFKLATIVDSNVGNGLSPTPHGEPLPFTSYSASLVTVHGKLRLYIEAVQVFQSFGGEDAFLPPPGAFMKIRLEIGPVGLPTDEVIFFTVKPTSGTSSAPHMIFSSVDLEADDITVGARIFHRITIKTDSGTYYRIVDGDIGESETTVEIPEVIWYPDRRAVRYELIIKNGENYELALTKQLNRHPESNYSYIILAEVEQTYTIGESAQLVDAPDMGMNQLKQYVPNRVQASISGNPFIFDAAANYRVGNRENDIVMGFAVNLNPTSQGQAGQYPVYAFSNKGVWALEQTGDPTIAFGRISPVSNFNGINNPYAIANAGALIVATDNKYIYTLAGLNVVRIDEAIANDPDYEDYLKQIRIGYHRASNYEEVLFSNPFYDYTLCYNTKYGVWYKATERFKFFFYDYPELMGLTVDNALKDFSDKDILSEVSWSLQTRPIQFGEPYVYKRLYPSIIRMIMRQSEEMAVESYDPVRFQLIGYRDTQQVTYNLRDESIKTNLLRDHRIYNQYAPMYAYRIIMSGKNYQKGSSLLLIDADMELMYKETRRRMNCSAQYFYALEEANISICHCADGGGSDARYVHTNLTGTLNEVVNHKLGKIPSVWVTDLEGYRIDCGVQLILSGSDPDLMRLRLTFEELQPYKAYFS